MVFADKVGVRIAASGRLLTSVRQRFARADKRAKLPRWINQYITDTASNLSTDMAIVLSKLFMRSISQNVNENQTGVSLWTLEDVQKAQEKQKAMMAEAEAEALASAPLSVTLAEVETAELAADTDALALTDAD